MPLNDGMDDIFKFHAPTEQFFIKPNRTVLLVLYLSNTVPSGRAIVLAFSTVSLVLKISNTSEKLLIVY